MLRSARRRWAPSIRWKARPRSEPSPSTAAIGSSRTPATTVTTARYSSRCWNDGRLSVTLVRRGRARPRARWPASERNAGSGSGSIVSGTHDRRAGNGRNGSSRTKSFSVVTMRVAPAAPGGVEHAVDVAPAEADGDRETPACRTSSAPAARRSSKKRCGPAMPATARTFSPRRATASASLRDVASTGSPICRLILNVSNGALRGAGPRASTSSSSASTASAASSASAGSRRRPPGSVRAAAARSSPRDDDEIDVAIELQVLEAVVEQVDRGAEMVLGEPAGEIAVARRPGRSRPAAGAPASAARRRRDRGRRGSRRRRGRRRRRPSASAPAVAAAQDRRPLAHLERAAARGRRPSASCRGRRRRGCRR